MRPLYFAPSLLTMAGSCAIVGLKPWSRANQTLSRLAYLKTMGFEGLRDKPETRSRWSGALFLRRVGDSCSGYETPLSRDHRLGRLDPVTARPIEGKLVVTSLGEELGDHRIVVLEPLLNGWTLPHRKRPFAIL